MVPGEAQFEKEVVVEMWLWAVRNLLTGNFLSKLWLSVGCTGKIEFLVN